MIFHIVDTQLLPLSPAKDSAMKHLPATLLMSFLIPVAASLPMPSAMAQATDDQDPARWQVEDSTPEAKYQTAKKEAGAALQEALAECKKLSKPEQAQCMKEARSRFQAEVTEAKERTAQ
jgi:hypothetical protein